MHLLYNETTGSRSENQYETAGSASSCDTQSNHGLPVTRKSKLVHWGNVGRAWELASAKPPEGNLELGGPWALKPAPGQGNKLGNDEQDEMSRTGGCWSCHEDIC